MHSSKTFTLGAILFIMNALSAQAFHVEYGTACETVGAACSYISDDSSAGGDKSTTVNGFCAPDLHCASQGAKCESDDSCLNYCGTDGTCGGQGAGCNTQDAFTPGQALISCFSSGDYTCSASGGQVGQCLPTNQVTLAETDDEPTTTTPQANDEDDSAISPVLAPSQANAARRQKRRLDSASSDAAYHANQVRSDDLRKAYARHAGRQQRKL